MTIRDLLTDSMKQIGVIASGETPAANEVSDALDQLNKMLGSWSISGLMVPFITRETLALTAGQQTYTIGVGGNLNTTKPTQIFGANILLSDTEYLVDVVNNQFWNGIATKNIQGIPNKLYFEPSFPLGKIHIYPKPESAMSLVLSSLKPFAKFTDLDAEFELPEGYDDAITSNLAVKLCRMFSRTVDPDLRQDARDTKLAIERKNFKGVNVVADTFGLFRGGSGFNVRTGE